MEPAGGGAPVPEHVDRAPRSWWVATPEASHRRAGAEAAVLVVLVAWNVLANRVVPGAVEIPFAVAGAAVLVAIARRVDLGWSQLGLGGVQLRRGLRIGAVVAAAVVVLVALLALIPAGRESLADDRFIGMGAAEVAYDSFLRIPIATAFAEEVAFRGVLLGLLLLWTSPLRAALLSSLLFGLWHILPGIAAVESTSVDLGSGAAVEIGAVAGQVVATSLAGLGFCWLRLRGRHLAAPTLAHWALNGSALVAGWVIVRNGWG